MGYEFGIVNLSAPELDEKTNGLTVRATLDVTGKIGDDENLGDLPSFGQLGVTAMPAPINSDGRAEGVIARRVEGINGVIIGARDTRSGPVYAALQPGDTCLHATGSQAAAQFQAKANRQAIVATKDTDGNTMVVNLDGKNNKVQITAFGSIFEIDKSKDQVFICTPGGKASIMMKGDAIFLLGTVVLGGRVPFTQLAACATPGTPPGPLNAGIPTPGVFLGQG